MPRIDLKKGERKYALHALKEMQKRDYKEIQFNLDMAKAENSVRDMSFGRMMLSIPEDHRRILGLLLPDLDSKDAQERTNAWKRFMKNPLSKPYRLNAKEKGGNAKAQPIYFNT